MFELREVLSGGKATGDVGNVNADTIDIASLDTAIAHATKLGAKQQKLKCCWTVLCACEKSVQRGEYTPMMGLENCV